MRRDEPAAPEGGDVGAVTDVWRSLFGVGSGALPAPKEMLGALAGVAEMLPDAFWVLAGDGRALYVNSAFRRIWGYSAEEINRDPSLIVRAIHPEDRSAVLELMDRSAAADLVYPEHRIIRPDGEVRWVRIRTSARTAPDGTLKLLVGIAEDITIRKRTEAEYYDAVQALRESESLYRMLVENQDQLVVKVDPAGRFLYVSPSYLALFGKAERELLGKTFMPMVHEDDLPATLAAMEQLKRPPYTCSLEQRALTRHGWRWLQWLDKAVVDSRGQITAIIGVGRDVTELREAREQLHKAKEEAEQANRTKDAFLAMLSHELRTPLTPVLATVTALQGDLAVPPAVKDELLMMQRHVELEARLIDDLLDLTRIAQGKLRLEPANVDAHELLQRALAISRSDLSLKGIRVDQRLSAGKSTLLADPARVQQVFWNILKNAVQFTGTGGQIQIRSRDDADMLVIAIQDSGVGIDRQFLPRIFDAFEQEGRSDARRGGLGLGLAISRTVVELHGGSITAESAGPGRGSTFTVRLPLADVQEPVQPQPAGPEASAPSPANRQALRILLVEDHASTLDILSRLLRKGGHQMTTASSLALARQSAQGKEFDLLISDIGLPDGSGLELMRELRDRPGLRAIALSGFGMDSDLSASQSAGFDAHLTKPVDVRTLTQTIHDVMSRPRPLREEP